jgi:hypothetical protein
VSVNPLWGAEVEREGSKMNGKRATVLAIVGALALAALLLLWLRGTTWAPLMVRNLQ